MFKRKRKAYDPELAVKEESLLFEFLEILLIGLIAVAIAMFIRTEVTIQRNVVGPSMMPTYNNGYYEGDTVYITRISKIRRGDVIVFRATEKKDYIKRVIGIEGDTIEFRIEGDGAYRVWRNGKRLQEDYILKDSNGVPKFTKLESCRPNVVYTVEEDCYFLMGDNRDDSLDSRDSSVGQISKSRVEGKVYLYVPRGDNYIKSLWRQLFG